MKNVKKPKKPQLLAPLKDWKSIAPQTKVLENADEVYFGLKTNFSMRARADNFDTQEINKLVEKVHDAGKKCYLTTNIVIYNTELVELYQAIDLAKKAGVDAVICHDLAAIMIAKDLGIPFHISTQANISNKVSAKFYENLGAERLILARELDLDDIKEIIKEVSTPVETFVHGAMCTAVSKRCYLSSEMMGFDREFSALRGKCVQPCRRLFKFMGEEGEEIHFEPESGMWFNAKDLCMIEHIPLLIQSGISAFKIEGRMRDPLYISETTACYREAIDAYYSDDFTREKVKGWKKRLKKVFNRGFHTGFYFTQPQPKDIQRDQRGNASKWHRVFIGRVINYYKKANAIEAEITHGRLSLGQNLIFENETDHFSTQTINSMRLDNESIDETEMACSENHIIVGIKVDHKVPINSKIYVLKEKNQNNEKRKKSES